MDKKSLDELAEVVKSNRYKMDGCHAILKGDEVVLCDLITWVSSMNDKETRMVAWTEGVGLDSVQTKVSTVFLGLDHGFGDKKLWFETMVFGGQHNHEQNRYTTMEEAKAGHKEMCIKVFGPEHMHPYMITKNKNKKSV